MWIDSIIMGLCFVIFLVGLVGWVSSEVQHDRERRESLERIDASFDRVEAEWCRVFGVMCKDDDVPIKDDDEGSA